MEEEQKQMCVKLQHAVDKGKAVEADNAALLGRLGAMQLGPSADATNASPMPSSGERATYAT